MFSSQDKQSLYMSSHMAEQHLQQEHLHLHSLSHADKATGCAANTLLAS
jgi:hypothetical protein